MDAVADTGKISIQSPEVRDLIKRIFTECAQYRPGDDVEAELIFDEAQNHYELLMQGWSGTRRIHGCVLHVDIKGDKIWIQHDGSPEGIAGDLMEAGIRPDQIVLGFRHTSERKHDIFAKG